MPPLPPSRAQAREGPSSILALREPQTRTKAAHAYEPNARPRSAAVAAEAVSGESTHAPGSPALRGPCTEGDDVSLARRSAAGAAFCSRLPLQRARAHESCLSSLAGARVLATRRPVLLEQHGGSACC